MELLLCKEKLVLPTSYKEQLQVLLEKRIEITIKLRKFKYEGRFNLINGHDIINLCGGHSSNEITKSLTIDELVVYITTEKMLKSILQDMATIDQEILIVAKKAGFFEVNSDFLNNVQKYIDPSNPVYNDYKYELLNM
jgi:hypothetical protein